MSDPTQTTVRRRLYLVTGVMCMPGNDLEVVPGCLLTHNENEARGAHLDFILKNKIGGLVQSISVEVLPDNLVLQAAREMQP